MHLSGVRPSVRPSVCSSVPSGRRTPLLQIYCCGSGDIDRLLHGRQPAVSSSCAAARRTAANAGSATSSADVRRNQYCIAEDETKRLFTFNHIFANNFHIVVHLFSCQLHENIAKTVHIRKEGPRSMNRDEGSYQLSHTYDRFLGSTLTHRAKNRKKKT